MAVRNILQLGNPLLNQTCSQVEESEIQEMHALVEDLHDTMMDFRSRWGVGRAIAAPQIGVMKRLVYMHIDRPVVFINPVLHDKSKEMMRLWDDCMSFPDLLVYLERHRKCSITFRDLDFIEHTWHLESDLSELLQHECDHLDGILAVSRALDGKSFSYRTELERLTRKSGGMHE